MPKNNFKSMTRLSSLVLSLVGCCLMLFLAACGQVTASLSTTQLGASNHVDNNTAGNMSNHVTTAPMPPTQTSCPANGQGRPAVFAPLSLGPHQNLIYIYNTPSLASLKRFDTSTGTKTTILTLTPGAAIYSAQLSTNGQFILFVTKYAHYAQLQMVRLDGQGLQTLYCAEPVNGLPNFIENALWSPNQQLTVFEEENPGGGPGAPVVKLYNLVTGAVQTYITPGTRFGYATRQWLNNTEVYMTGSYFSNIAAPTNVFILDIAKSTNQQNNTRQVATIKGYNWEMNLSTDGTKLILSQCSDTLDQTDPNAPSIISSQNATGGILNPIYISHVFAVTQVRVIGPNTLLMVLGGKFGGDPQDGLWKMNMDGTGLVHLTSDGRLLSDTRSAWSSVSRDGTLYATIGYDYTSNGNTLPYKVLFGSLNGGTTTQVALTNSGENAAIVGWTTF
ncbi:MAG: hypothetical protein NVS4B11_09800 [Ktedonobacteraceae bacterium]